MCHLPQVLLCNFKAVLLCIGTLLSLPELYNACHFMVAACNLCSLPLSYFMIPVCNMNLSLSGCWKQPSTCTKEPHVAHFHTSYMTLLIFICKSIIYN